MNKKVILVHGFSKNKKDMQTLKENLEKIGYKCILIDLPLTFKEIEHCSSIFEQKIKETIYSLKENEKINLVGHSTGGLIIRHFLSNTKYVDKINRCVLISTPNNGSQLANIASKLSIIFINIFKTLKSLRSESVKSLNLKHIESVEIGAIAGNKNNLLLGKLLKTENDGRVQVNSVKYKELKDFIVVPYGHKEIHHKYEIAELVNTFIENGHFR
ncbi:lipase family alpha/beta hydrolase [Tepidibacter thalassicus]|uniref:Putative serine esterase n=1 Tax=Tepidibacter thalassicus DSM 15285 TaxID=1123350 RepID=A0A1M5QYY5_9FIRM|nr:alpha/beta fold hydrolase [Tepidibacter thalassicus]SHH19345.1 Putative serine esterase [Tepidibacter thalassicus DSM 15285]